MKITDEQLSAFLDNELDEQQMSRVRDAIAQDDTLCDRLAALSMVDHVVKTAAEQATNSPVPAHLEALCDAEQESNVASFVRCKTQNADQKTVAQGSNVRWLRGMAMAASVALVGLLGWQQLMDGQSSGNSEWQQVAAVLDSQTSGQAYQAGVQTVMPQLSFLNKDGALCRQFTVTGTERYDAMIACKLEGSWQQRAAVALDKPVGQLGEYQTAASVTELDNVLDEIMQGAPLNREQEQNAIQTNWQQ